VVVHWWFRLAGVTWCMACDWVHASPACSWHAQLKLARGAQVARPAFLLHGAQEGRMVHGLQTAVVSCTAMQHGAGKMGAVRQR